MRGQNRRQSRRFAGICIEFDGPAGVTEPKVERLMSLRIAVALAATLSAGMLVSTAAQARPDKVGLRGDY
jgi:hypothetical protein